MKNKYIIVTSEAGKKSVIKKKLVLFAHENDQGPDGTKTLLILKGLQPNMFVREAFIVVEGKLNS